jgi:hypothetical protein
MTMMKKICINEPSTLLMRKNRNVRCATIYNNKGKVIYKRFFNGHADNFSLNVPTVGTYYFGQELQVRDRLHLVPNKVKFSLPEPERNKFKPFKIEFNEKLNGTPARIFTDAGVIEIGANYYKYAPPTRLFILLHELGHYFYKTEWKTDTFALYYYLKLGYNKSQAFYSLSKVLHPSEGNMKRILNLFNKTK